MKLGAFIRQLLPLGACALFSASAAGATPWGKDYFPNTALTTQDDKVVKFFDDLIKDKIVVINFVYTSCPDTCPLETAQLVQVQNILGDRLGKDVFFYSISLDPKTDTPAVLKEYQQKFGAKWTFLTGDINEVWNLQKKLGLFLEEIRNGLNNHNVNMIIGNQATGRWMKRSPMENPYVLADHIGNWLDGWKRPPELDGYENAPTLRDLPRGEQLFRTRCASCHTVTGLQLKNSLGPDLLGVTRRREQQWLLNWLRAPDQMLKDKDPIALALYEQYNKLAMPNLRLNQEEATDLLIYLEGETQRVLGEKRMPPPEPENPPTSKPADDAIETGPFKEVVTVTNSWIREAHPAAKINTGYLTLKNSGPKPVTLSRIRSTAFGNVEICEMAKVGESFRRQKMTELIIPANAQVELKSGGRHLVFTERHRTLTAGEQIKLVLTFESGIRQQIVAQVGEP